MALTSATFTLPTEDCWVTASGIQLQNAVAGDSVSLVATVDNWANTLLLGDLAALTASFLYPVLRTMSAPLTHPAFPTLTAGATVQVAIVLVPAANRTGVVAKVSGVLGAAPSLIVRR